MVSARLVGFLTLMSHSSNLPRAPNDYDPLTAYLLFGRAKPAVPLDLDGRGLHRRIAQQTIALPNRKAWTSILPALKAAGVSHQDALDPPAARNALMHYSSRSYENSMS